MRQGLWGLLLLISCKGSPSTEAGPATSVSAAPVASASAAPAGPAKAWYEGAWQGTYQAELSRLETAAGGLKAWKEDDGSKASGEGKLSIQAAADGTVTGTASGPLGEHTVSGKVEGDRVALALTPVDPSGYRGVALASQEAEAIKGELTCATGDGLSARKAKLALARATK